MRGSDEVAHFDKVTEVFAHSVFFDPLNIQKY